MRKFSKKRRTKNFHDSYGKLIDSTPQPLVSYQVLRPGKNITDVFSVLHWSTKKKCQSLNISHFPNFPALIPNRTIIFKFMEPILQSCQFRVFFVENLRTEKPLIKLFKTGNQSYLAETKELSNLKLQNQQV